MKKVFSIGFWMLFATCLTAQQNDSITIRKIYSEVLTNGKCYQTLDYLCNKIGQRLSASNNAAKAVSYTAQQMYNFGFDTVYLQPIVVPHWIRGEKEIGNIVKGKKEIKVHVCALGNSVGTRLEGVQAPVIEVQNFKQLAELGTEKIKGKIVFFNRPMDPTYISTGRAYGEAGNQRGRGPLEAAKYGAVGVVVRSLTLALDTNPHTGYTHYVDTIPWIPGCAISTVDANLLSDMLKEDTSGSVEFYFRQTCERLMDELSYNVIGELRGSEKKEEVLVVGGHLDSWDLGTGAHDDGAGVTQSIEAVRAMKALKLKPKRTIRCVLFMNEENGVKGGNAFAKEVKTKNEKVLVAIESDGGGFTPRGFNVDDPNASIKFQKWIPLLKPYGIETIKEGHSGTDIEPLKDNGTITIGYVVDSQRYFDYHHTAIDTFDKVNKRELELGAASMASLLWLISEYGIK